LKRNGYNKFEELKTIEEEIKKLRSSKTTLDKIKDNNNINNKSSNNNFFSNSINANLNKRISSFGKMNLNSSTEENKIENLKRNSRAQSTSLKFFQMNSTLRKGETLATGSSVAKNNISIINKSGKKK